MKSILRFAIYLLFGSCLGCGDVVITWKAMTLCKDQKSSLQLLKAFAETDPDAFPLTTKYKVVCTNGREAWL